MLQLSVESTVDFTADEELAWALQQEEDEAYAKELIAKEKQQIEKQQKQEAANRLIQCRRWLLIYLDKSSKFKRQCELLRFSTSIKTTITMSIR
jgi:hypothetical protein